MEADCTSEHHPCLVALSEATRRAVFPPDLVHNAVISPGAQVAVVACWVKKKKTMSTEKIFFSWVVFSNTGDGGGGADEGGGGEARNEAGKGVVGPSSTNAATQERTETARRGKLDRGKAVRTEWHGRGETQWLLHISHYKITRGWGKKSSRWRTACTLVNVILLLMTSNDCQRRLVRFDTATPPQWRCCNWTRSEFCNDALRCLLSCMVCNAPWIHEPCWLRCGA